MNLKALIVAAGLASLAPWVALAANDAPVKTTASATGYAEGEVKKIDAEQGKITLKHGPIDNLGMPGMTMVFRADAKALANVKVGDTIKFKADKIDGAIKVTEIAAR